MNAFFKGAAAAALLMAAGTGTVAAADDAKVINFGIISTESSQNLKTIWDPFLAAMSEQTGMEVKPFFASDYAGVIEGMRFGKVDVAWFGNKSAMEAVDRAGGEVFAQTVDSEGNPGYWSLLITHKDSPLSKLEDVLACDQSLTFGLGDPNSTSGFLVPTTFVYAQRGIDPRKCYKTVTNASHEANLMAVAAGQVDFATNNTENMRRLEKTAPEARAKIKVIWQSPLIPSDPLVWRKDLDQAMKDKVYTFIMTFGRIGSPEEVEQERQILTGLQWAPFRPSSDAQLYPIRVLAISKDMAKIEADEGMSAAEKEEKLKTLKAEKAKYEMLMEKVPQA
ncbi:phosphonate ABC transporter substrate-binding protein [Marinibaculum pumilum]|uniref:Phosphonate ABC transporter substrate-binding protein n=1 Tax=Marinibaculum pumilum TaxID=1766165 RepID=A0ABV7L1V5_9PROT